MVLKTQTKRNTSLAGCGPPRAEEDFSRLTVVIITVGIVALEQGLRGSERSPRGGSPSPRGETPSLMISQIIITLYVNTDLLAKD